MTLQWLDLNKIEELIIQPMVSCNLLFSIKTDIPVMCSVLFRQIICFFELDVQLVTRSEEETIPSTSQPPSSRHPPSSESQTADQTERVEDLDGPAARGQLSDTDHGMDSHILNSENQSTCCVYVVSVCS